jgi:hypothetical protein
MLAYTGPRNGGKSFVNMRLVNFLGDGPNYLGKQFMGKYLSCSLRDDGNASNPTTNQFRGKKLISFKELVSKPIEPETLKNVLDPADGYVDARHNNSRPDEITGFPITFVLAGCGNTSVRVKTTPGQDHGCGGKIHEITTCFSLVAAPTENNPLERLCDTSIPGQSRAGEYDGELFYWACAMYQTITPDVCKARHMMPLPPSVVETSRILAAESQADLVKQWVLKKTVPCAPQDATDWNILRALIEQDLGSIDGAVWAECGMIQRMMGRFRNKPQKIDRYHVLFADTPGGKRVPRKLDL